MARVVIEIDGDATGAEDALEDVNESMGRLEGTAESTSGSIGGVNAKLVNAASAVSIAKAGFDALRGGIDMLWESTERYFQSSEDGQEQWEALERQARALKGMLFELFIGTTDQSEAFDRMSALLGDLVTAARGAMQILQPMAGLLRGGLAIGARAVAAAFGDAGSMTERFAGQVEEAEERLQSLQLQLDGQNDSIGQGLVLLNEYGTDFSRAAADGARTMATVDGMEFNATGMSDGFDEATANLQRGIADLLSTATSVADLDVPLSATYTDGLRVVGRGVDSVRESLEDLTVTIGGRQMTALEAWESQLVVVNTLLDEEDEAARRGTEGVRVSTSAHNDAADVLRGFGGVMGAAGVMAMQLATSEEFLTASAQAATTAYIDQQKAITFADAARTSQLERKMANMDAAAEYERAILNKTEQLKDQHAEKDAARSARQAEQVNRAKGGFSALATSAATMAVAAVQSGKQSRDEIRKLIGGELVSYGMMGLAKAAMMAFEPGKQGLAVGLGIASAAAIGIGAKMGANASAGGAPAAPAASSAGQSTTNVTFQNNFSQIGSRQQFLRATGDTFQQAVEEGYISMPRN